jgi:threonyl-tRNA synthetase
MSSLEVGLPDGRKLAVPLGATVLEVAARIGPRLAKAALAGRVDGKLVDLRTPLTQSAELQIVTDRDPQAGEVIRHSAEHVLADAVKRLFPEAQVDAGRAEHSEKFQYDFQVARPFTPEDLALIEAEMRRILAEGATFTREVVTREQARALFAGLGEELKLSRLDDIPAGEEITVFRHGRFVDLCRGPHVQHTGQIGAIKLLESSGNYWRGDERNPMLQRIYGTAFATQKQLDEHLAAVELARARDHRRLGPQLKLFHLDPLSPGAPFWLPRGMALYNGLVAFVRSLYPKYGYSEVMAPQLFRAELFKTSGHYENFRDDMFWFAGADEGEELGVKAMNCPGHCHLFGLEKRSYRDLPLRLAEFSRLHRNERSGTLTGLSRVRPSAASSASRRTGSAPSRPSPRASATWATSAGSSPGTPPSTARRSRATCATRSAAPGPSARSRWTWRCRGASASATSGATARSTSPRCCTARCSARSSASSRSTSSTPPETSRSGSPPIRWWCCPSPTAITSTPRRCWARSPRPACARGSTTAPRS